jgi:MFS family permease
MPEPENAALVAMKNRLFNIPAGWLIVIGVALVLFGTSGARFSFGVFLKPLAEDFGWSRGSLSGALAIAGLFTALFRPLSGWLADRYDPRYVALTGVALGGVALIGLSRINSLWQFYALFIVMGTGFTFASPATITKLVSAHFTRNRGLALSLAGSGSAIGETALVPFAAIVLTLGGWKSAYIALAIVLLVVVIPVAYLLLRVRASGDEDDSIDEESAESATEAKLPVCAWAPDEGLGLKQALKTPMFWGLTAGFFA